MKQKVQRFIESHNHTAHYSGKTKTMFITGSNAEAVELKVIKVFGMGLPFKTASQAEQMSYPKRVNRYAKGTTLEQVMEQDAADTLFAKHAKTVK
jgi:hypothetical protein